MPVARVLLSRVLPGMPGSGRPGAGGTRPRGPPPSSHAEPRTRPASGRSGPRGVRIGQRRFVDSSRPVACANKLIRSISRPAAEGGGDPGRYGRLAPHEGRPGPGGASGAAVL